MGHISEDKDRLVKRVRRIKGQVEAIERALERDDDCYAVLQLIAASRGAMTGLMAEVLEGHIRHHIIDPKRRPSASETRGIEETIKVLRSFLK